MHSAAPSPAHPTPEWRTERRRRSGTVAGIVPAIPTPRPGEAGQRRFYLVRWRSADVPTAQCITICSRCLVRPPHLRGFKSDPSRGAASRLSPGLLSLALLLLPRSIRVLHDDSTSEFIVVDLYVLLVYITEFVLILPLSTIPIFSVRRALTMSHLTRCLRARPEGEARGFLLTGTMTNRNSVLRHGPRDTTVRARKMMPHPAPVAGIHSGHCLLSGASSPEPQEFLSDSDSLKQQTSPEIT